MIRRSVTAPKPIELRSGMECMTSRAGDGSMHLLWKYGGSIGFVVCDQDHQLLVETKSELAREGSGAGILAALVAAFCGLVLTAAVLYAVWQHGRAYGLSEAPFVLR